MAFPGAQGNPSLSRDVYKTSNSYEPSVWAPLVARLRGKIGLRLRVTSKAYDQRTE
jgi:hypothetical protein